MRHRLRNRMFMQPDVDEKLGVAQARRADVKPGVAHA